MALLALCLALVILLPIIVIASVIARSRPEHPRMPSLPPMAPQWAADPSGAHEFRYWDGTRWTDTVADAGVVTADPLPPH